MAMAKTNVMIMPYACHAAAAVHACTMDVIMIIFIMIMIMIMHDIDKHVH